MLDNKTAVNAVPAGEAGAPLLCVRDASYTKPGYRSFEFASFEVGAGQVCCVCAGRREPVRDLLLALAGAVRLTHGEILFPQAEGCGDLPSRRVAASGVGLCVVSTYCDVDAYRTVEEAVRHEHAACGERRSAWDALEFLAAFGLATHADRRVDLLEPDARARLSAALSHVGEPAVSVVDLTDPFCCGLTEREAEALISDLRAIARRDGACFVLGTGDPFLLKFSDVPVALDVASLEGASVTDSPEVR